MEIFVKTYVIIVNKKIVNFGLVKEDAEFQVSHTEGAAMFETREYLNRVKEVLNPRAVEVKMLKRLRG